MRSQLDDKVIKLSRGGETKVYFAMLNSSAYDGTVEFNIAKSKKGSGF